MDDYGFLEGSRDVSLEFMRAIGLSMALRDRLLRPLLEAAVRGGAAALPLALARSLDCKREAKWGGAGAAWSDA